MHYYFSCPSCGSNRDFSVPREETNSSAGLLLFFFGGFLPWLIYSSNQTGRIQCRNCGYIFRKPQLPSSPMSKFAFWIMCVLVLGLSATTFMVAVPDIYQGILDYTIVDVFVQFVTDHPAPVALGMLATFTTLFVLCTIVHIIANRRERERVAATYATDPTIWRN